MKLKYFSPHKVFLGRLDEGQDGQGDGLDKRPMKFPVQSTKERKMMKVMKRPSDPLLQEEVGHHSENMTEVVFPFPGSTCCKSPWTKFLSLILRLKSVVNRGTWGNH